MFGAARLCCRRCRSYGSSAVRLGLAALRPALLFTHVQTKREFVLAVYESMKDTVGSIVAIAGFVIGALGVFLSALMSAISYVIAVEDRCKLLLDRWVEFTGGRCV